jgi:hypothetical protein
MAINEIQIALSAHDLRGHPIEPAAFVSALGVDVAPYQVYGSAERWRAVGLTIGRFQVQDFQQYENRWEAFDSEVDAWLTAFAKWLSGIQRPNLDALRGRGWELRVTINLEIDGDQMDLTLPPEFCTEVGRLGLYLFILSNE